MSPVATDVWVCLQHSTCFEEASAMASRPAEALNKMKDVSSLPKKVGACGWSRFRFLHITVCTLASLHTLQPAHFAAPFTMHKNFLCAPLRCSCPKYLAGPQDFERIKLIGQGDVGKVYLVRLKESTHYFAMKVLSKTEMIARNKV